jgi:DNA-binding Lrp family transcriptional regulator
MPMIYALINAKVRDIEDIMEKIYTIPHIAEVNIVTGTYDMVVELKGDDLEELLGGVTKRIQSIPGINRIDTLICMREAAPIWL